LNFPLLVKFPAFCGTWSFITISTRACHMFLSWDRWIQSTPSHHISWRSVLILFSHVSLGFLKWSLSFKLSHQNVDIFVFSFYLLL
jgi:hypothetical protein